MKLIIDISEGDYAPFKFGKYIIVGGLRGNGKTLMSAIYKAIANGTPLPKGHGRLIDADALADKLQEVSVLQRYEDVKIDHRCTVADVLTSLTHDLKGTALLGYELCPTIIEADKAESEDEE